MVIDYSISIGNIGVFLGSAIMSVIGWFIVRTLNEVTKQLAAHDRRLVQLEVENAASRGYDKGYADARREASAELARSRQI